MRLETVATERYRDSVKAVLDSAIFQDAPVQQKLLAYLASKSFEGSAGDLKEYSIGVELFGKPASYSPQTDPSVRVQAGRLRRKLEDYYRGEGAGATGIVQLPKGSFNLVFEERSFENPPLSIAPTASLPDPDPVPGSSRAVRLATFAAVLFCAVAIWQTVQVRGLRKEVAQRALHPALAQFWSPILSSPRPLLVVVGVPLFIQMSGGSFRHSQVNLPEDVAKVPAVQELLRETKMSSPHFSGIYTGVGEAAAVFSLGRMFEAGGKAATISRSNELGWDEAMSHDLILLGSSKSQPQLRELGVLVNYRLVPGGIEVLHPLPGEPGFYAPTALPHQAEPVDDYSIIARLPGINGNGYVMVIGADSTNGTWAGTEFVTDPRRASTLLAHLRDSAGKLPDYFEMIVQEHFKGGRPVSMTYVRHRVLGFPPGK